MIVPVATAHVGCVSVVVGAAGGVGCGLTVTELAGEVQVPLLAVTLYVPGATLLKTPVVLVYVVPSMLYVMPAAGAGVLIVIVPVATAHVGCVSVVVGAAGGVGCGLMVTELAGEVHVPFLAVTLYVPGATLLNTPVVFVYVDPSMLYVIPAAGAGVFTVIVPVATAHVGCVSVVVGAAGGVGCGFIVTELAGEVQVPFLAVTLYVPGATLLNTPVVFVYVDPSML